MTRTRSILLALVGVIILIGTSLAQSAGPVYLPLITIGSGTNPLAPTATATHTALPTVTPTDVPTLPPTITPTAALPTETPTITSTATETRTPSATRTPLPSATPTRISAPTRTASPTPSGSVSVVSSSTYESSSYLHLVGEIRNTTANPREFVKVSARFYSAGGQVLTTDFTYTYMSTVTSGAKACFDMILSTPSGWTSYQFDTVQSSVASQGPPSLIAQHVTSQLDAQKNYRISGEVRNSENTTITYVQPIATLYNNQGTVVDCDFTYVNSQDIAAGGTSGFTLSTYGRDESDVASYTLSVDGTRP